MHKGALLLLLGCVGRLEDQDGLNEKEEGGGIKQLVDVSGE
jgi:hypothetical protein